MSKVSKTMLKNKEFSLEAMFKHYAFEQVRALARVYVYTCNTNLSHRFSSPQKLAPSPQTSSLAPLVRKKSETKNAPPRCRRLIEATVCVQRVNFQYKQNNECVQNPQSCNLGADQTFDIHEL